MALDPRFVVTSDLESYFVDKDSGEPLAGGVVTFYHENNQSTKKPVYQISVNSPGVYTYSPLPNPCILSDVGTFQDALGNNIVPYYFPFDGTPDPDGSNGTVDLYYITVDSSGGVRQFTRHGWPNNSDSGGNNSTLDITNYIPNGQFLAHTQIVNVTGVASTEPPVTVIPFGTGTLDSQAIAQGGWSFRKSTGSTSVFANSFSQILGAVPGLTDFPRYGFNFKCTSFVALDTSVADLTISWPDVNKFSSSPTSVGTQNYTFFFAATSNDGNTYSFDIYMVYYFGTGGSPSAPISTKISTVTVGNSYANHVINITGFPANAGTIGTNNDDYVALSIRGKSPGWDAQFTDFALVLGSVALTAFPEQTNADMLSEGVAGWMPTPNPDGSDLYLPLVLTAVGMTFDHSIVGSISGKFTATPSVNELLCDGSNYSYIDYNAVTGIPYSRLGDALFNSTINAPIFGTGSVYVTGMVSAGDLTSLILVTNQVQGGSTTDPSDGASPTGFNFSIAGTRKNLGTGVNSGYDVEGSSFTTASYVNFVANFVGNTSGGVAATVNTFPSAVFNSWNSANLQTGYYSFYTSVPPAAALVTGGAGLYFRFRSDTTQFLMWFNTGTEADPVVLGPTHLPVNVLPTFTTHDVANMITVVATGRQSNIITMTAAASIPGGAYFNFHASGFNFIVWYLVNNIGTEPATVVDRKIKVTLTGSETAAQVVAATQIAINKQFFQVPDLRGVFLRGNDPDAIWDLTVAKRWAKNPYLEATLPGTTEIGLFEQHSHPMGNTATGGGATNGSAGSGTSTGLTGNEETRPVNTSINWFIKY